MPGKYTVLNEALHNYALAQRSHADDPILSELHEVTQTLGEVSQMAIGLDQAALISLLVALIGSKWAVEVGTFTGASSIAIARYIMPGGKLICFDQDFKYTSIARRYWIKAGVQDRIDLRLGDARRLLPHFKPRELVDFVFIDADKESYDFYYETIMPYVRTGGLILFDNMLRGGELIDPSLRTKPANRAIDTLNRKLAADDRIQCVLLPIGDGVTVCRKLYVPGMDGRRPAESRRLI
jgi:caffeoyl-CoA O-methyltransferase